MSKINRTPRFSFHSETDGTEFVSLPYVGVIERNQHGMYHVTICDGTDEGLEEGPFFTSAEAQHFVKNYLTGLFHQPETVF